MVRKQHLNLGMRCCGGNIGSPGFFTDQLPDHSLGTWHHSMETLPLGLISHDEELRRARLPWAGPNRTKRSQAGLNLGTLGDVRLR